MDYEQEYKDAISRAKIEQETFFNLGNISAKKAIERIFPELKESEDERIIRTLKEIINWGCAKNISVENNVELKDCLAWLEKKGKQNTIVNESPSKEIILAVWELGNIWKELTKGNSCTEYGTQLQYIQKHWNESDYYEKLQGEQKPAWSEEDEKIYQSIIDDTVQENQLDCNQITWIKFLKNRVHPKQEWSEEDKLVLKQAIYVCHQNGYTAVEDWLKSLKDRVQPQPKQELSEEDEKIYQSILDDTVTETQLDYKQITWLKSLKDRIQPQSKQEWSEEDEKKINGLVKGLEDRMGFGWANQPFTREEYIEWLKALKDRIQPQPHWKPSKKQLMALRDLLSGTYSIEHSETYQTIESLYQDLKNYNYGKI